MSDDELLEYETEAEPPPDLQAIPVCVAEPVLTVPTVPQHSTCYTLVIDSDVSRFVELLPADALRLRATIIVSDQAVVICDSRSQAGSRANQTTDVPAPVGAYVPASTTPLVLTGTNEFFVAATSATAARVSVIVERRSP